MALTGVLLPASGAAPVAVAADGTVSVAVGTTAGTVAAGDDARFSGAPGAHAASHAAAGSDPLTPAAIGALPAASGQTLDALSLTGQTRIAAGSAAAPALCPAGDLDTGLWAPAANALALSTAGTERLRLDGNGLLTGSGPSLGAWTAHTPTLSGPGWGLGNAAVTSYWARIGRVVLWRCRIAWGSPSPFGTGQPTLTAPADAAGWADATAFARFVDISAATPYQGAVAFNAAGTVQPWITKTDGTYATVVAATGSVPAAWAASDFWSWSIAYEATP